MTEEEFVAETSRLEQYYEKEYSSIQIKTMYEQFKNLNKNRYRQLITAVIRECRLLPRVADIVKVSRETTFKDSSDEKEEKTDCKICGGSGYLIYSKKIKDANKEHEYQYACICSCRNAKKYEGWKTSDTRYRTKYYTPYAEEIGLYKGGMKNDNN